MFLVCKTSNNLQYIFLLMIQVHNPITHINDLIWTEHSPCARCYSTGAHCCKKWEHSPTPPGLCHKDLAEVSELFLHDFRDADNANQQTSLKNRAPAMLMSRRFSMFSFSCSFLHISYFILFLNHGVTHFAAHPPSRRSRPRCVDQLLEALLSCSNRPTLDSEPCWVSHMFPPSGSMKHTFIPCLGWNKSKQMSLKHHPCHIIDD